MNYNQGSKFGNDKKGDPLAYPEYNGNSSIGDGGGKGFPGGHGGPGGPFLGQNQMKTESFCLEGPI